MSERVDPSSAASDREVPCPPSFEQALAQLEQIVHQLEEGEVGLAEALDHYEKGVGLLKQCYGLLERAERRIELLSGVDSAGNPITEPFSDEESSLDEKSQNRSRRRTKTGANSASSEKKLSGGPFVSPKDFADSAQTRMDEPGSLF